MTNKWKIAFLVLLGIEVVIAIGIFTMALRPSKDNQNIQFKQPSADYVAFHVKSNKYDLNQLINHYLEEQAAGTPINYHVLLKNEVELYGSLPVLSQLLHMKLTFAPVALKNGDLVLKQKSMSIGSLNLPISFVLNLISQNFQFPQGVEIQPNNKLIYIHMQQLKLKSDIKIKAGQFDLQKNKIAFTILVPVK